MTGESLGYGYINFHTKEDTYKAFLEKNYQKIDDVTRIRLSPAIRDTSVRNDPSLNLFVKNLPEKVGSYHLWKLFKSTGTISCVAPFNKETGKLYGYGFLAYLNTETVEEVKQKYNGRKIKGNIIEIENYKKQGEREKPFTNIFIKGMKFKVPNEEASKIIGLQVTSVYTPDVEKKNYTAVNFKTSEGAEEFMEKANKEGLVDYNGKPLLMSEAKEALKKDNPEASAEELEKLEETEFSELKVERFTSRKQYL
eukprot:CAMPEP_0117423234 /NCGR_PEP_ID=MMETSP0758-20121206/3906_1 /TAXON_ID=63605 /ORGANISM="Percolomonas cosmopolitus, Strain AE-1 (ATCC 50343)" /LENGTH=252 /DNA_ID=CAMNT_0005206315 /DNA_START=153 /DNA_END=908 /DNA_ORIENTATION=-